MEALPACTVSLSPIIMSGKLKSASGTQTIAGIKYERRVKDKSDQYCKYCRHKSYLSNIFMKTCGPTVPTLQGLSASTFTFKGLGCVRRTVWKYCINLINTSITCNPTNTVFIHSYSATQPPQQSFHQWELSAEHVMLSSTNQRWNLKLIDLPQLFHCWHEHYILHLQSQITSFKVFTNLLWNSHRRRIESQ